VPPDPAAVLCACDARGGVLWDLTTNANGATIGGHEIGGVAPPAERAVVVLARLLGARSTDEVRAASKGAVGGACVRWRHYVFMQDTFVDDDACYFACFPCISRSAWTCEPMLGTQNVARDRSSRVCFLLPLHLRFVLATSATRCGSRRLHATASAATAVLTAAAATAVTRSCARALWRYRRRRRRPRRRRVMRCPCAPLARCSSRW
jgi:hypothetical protein